MIKVPLRDLSEALTNPAAYVRRRKRESKPTPRKTKYGMFRHAVFEYHRNGEDLNLAQKYLEKKFITHFKKRHDLPSYMRKLDVYAREFQKLGSSVAKTRHRIALELPDEYDNFVVSGQVARVDLRPQGGYSIWLFVRDAPDWHKELRMPLLQSAYAVELNVTLNEVEVGVYDFEIGEYRSTVYSGSRVRAAKDELIGLLRQLRTLPSE